MASVWTVKIYLFSRFSAASRRIQLANFKIELPRHRTQQSNVDCYRGNNMCVCVGVCRHLCRYAFLPKVKYIENFDCSTIAAWSIEKQGLQCCMIDSIDDLKIVASSAIQDTLVDAVENAEVLPLSALDPPWKLLRCPVSLVLADNPFTEDFINLCLTISVTNHIHRDHRIDI